MGQESNRVIGKFRKDIEDMVEIITGAISKGNKEDALVWLNELRVTLGVWTQTWKEPRLVIAAGSFGRGLRVAADTRLSKELAEVRVAIATDALKKVVPLLEGKGWLTE